MGLLFFLRQENKRFLPRFLQFQEVEAQAFVLAIPKPKHNINKTLNLQKKILRIYGSNTVRGRTVKPLLRATPERDSPKSTPRLNPPLHSGSFFRRRALGGISWMDNRALNLLRHGLSLTSWREDVVKLGNRRLVDALLEKKGNWFAYESEQDIVSSCS